MVYAFFDFFWVVDGRFFWVAGNQKTGVLHDLTGMCLLGKFFLFENGNDSEWKQWKNQMLYWSLDTIESFWKV